ncbi:unnamed protein product [Rotaria sp. Silwood1]|nr:unnamed protein product [Rotaria sp. Silwood1]
MISIISPDSHVCVAMDRHAVSYGSIHTNSLSSCLCLLLDGIVDRKPFCFLLHSSRSQESEDDALNDLLVHLLEALSKSLKEALMMDSSSITDIPIKNLKLLVAGGPIGHRELTRKSFSLLNENSIINEIESLTTDPEVIYLVKQLLNSVVVVSPITYLTTEEHEMKGQLN